MRTIEIVGSGAEIAKFCVDNLPKNDVCLMYNVKGIDGRVFVRGKSLNSISLLVKKYQGRVGEPGLDFYLKDGLFKFGDPDLFPWN